jgi:NAD(P)H-hydrate epimerase
MENAGKNIADRILRRYPGVRRPLVLVGPGNNGGDGLVIARHLLIHQRFPIVLLTRKPSCYRGETQENLTVLQHLLGDIFASQDLTDEEIDEMARQCDLVIDSLLGTGSSGAPRGEVLRLIRHIPAGVPVVAVDIPTGLDPDSGEVWEVSVKADFTATLLASKPGLHVTPGANRTGPVEVCHIGIPSSSVLPKEASAVLVNENDLKDFLPERPANLHKGKRGSLLILGGSACFRGAVALACKGALRSGAGVVVAAVPEEMASSLASQLPEVVIFPIPSVGGCLPADALERCLDRWGRKFPALVLGPGLGRTDETIALTRNVWNSWDGPCLVDADALFGLARSGQPLPRSDQAVLTPHEGEAGTLLGKSPSAIAKNRLSAVRELAKKWGTALLKGPGSIIDDGLQSYILTAGHPCLSVPGSGDVLSGTIGAFLASGMPPLKAALGGTLLHAVAGNLLGAEIGIDGVLAGEIPDRYPSILSRARRESAS